MSDDISLDEMTFKQALYMTQSKALKKLTDSQAAWLDAMDEPPLVSEVVNLPSAVFTGLYADVLKSGPDVASFQAFHEIFKLEVGHPHVTAVEQLLLALSDTPPTGVDPQIWSLTTDKPVAHFERLFVNADFELFKSIFRQSDSIGWKCLDDDAFMQIVLATGQRKFFMIVSLFHGFRRNKEVREWLEENPTVKKGLQEFSATVYGEDW